jgi:hypothetical protein
VQAPVTNAPAGTNVTALGSYIYMLLLLHSMLLLLRRKERIMLAEKLPVFNFSPFVANQIHTLLTLRATGGGRAVPAAGMMGTVPVLIAEKNYAHARYTHVTIFNQY